MRRALVLSLAIHFLMLTGGLPMPLSWPIGQPAGGGYSLKAKLRQPAPIAVDSPGPPAPDMAAAREEGSSGRRSASRHRGETTAKAVHPGALPAGESLADISNESLSEYRLALARTAKRLRYQRSPARWPGAAGEVVLAIVVAPGRALPVVILEHSSGHPGLDEAALTIIGEAAKAQPLPAGLRNRQLRINLPVHFGQEGPDQSASGSNSDS